MLPYVKPVSYQLSHDLNESRKNVCFQYVPILQSLKLFLSHAEVMAQFFSSQTTGPNHSSHVHDYKDGIVFKAHRLFSSKEHSIQLILYQDAFEVVNPLGSARTVHKLLAVYYVLGNLHPHMRSRVNSMQLVLLCEEKHINQANMEVLFRPLLDDLRVLETEGISVNGHENICGSLFAIAGDNLGSNWLGGYITNFSSADYSCRYCESQKNDFTTNNRISRPLRTADSYDTSVNLKANSNQTHVQGIKFSSPFNSLLYYHVFNPGLPPCIAHDLFEGVVAYDMMLFVKYFLKHGWFSESYLNFAITQFSFDELSRNSKCVVFKNTSLKIAGNACQIWCFIRFFPLFVFHKVRDWTNPVWKAVLLLRIIVELVCAPKLSYTQISCLSDYIDEYLDLRSAEFPGVRLRPKHHFMTHYPWLILQFGPLV